WLICALCFSWRRKARTDRHDALGYWDGSAGLFIESGADESGFRSKAKQGVWPFRYWLWCRLVSWQRGDGLSVRQIDHRCHCLLCGFATHRLTSVSVGKGEVEGRDSVDWKGFP